MLNEDNLISTLEQSLRQFQAAEQRLQERLRKIEDEARDLKVEIEALQSSAEKTEEALESLFSTMRSGSKSWKTHRKINTDENDYAKKSRYEDENDYAKNSRYDEMDYGNNSRYNPEDDYQNAPISRRYANRQPMNQAPPPNSGKHSAPNNGNQPNHVNHQQQPNNNNYRGNSVSYINNNRNLPSLGQNIEPISKRFADRTITQACTLLLREANYPLHVNEIYNLLCAGGMEFKGNNPTISIAVSLTRNRRFKKVAPGTFDLVMRDASQAAS